jgi:hypothetical protein
MCTLVVSREPDARCPLLVVAVRDEMLDRDWRPPAHHWPDHPDLVGGLDLLAGGTWLAVRPATPDRDEGVRIGCVLNGTGAPAPEATRRSRGDLPLRAAAGGTLAGIDPAPYDPFHLILVGTGGDEGEVLSWDGHAERRFPLGVGTHFFDNHGYWHPGQQEPGTPRAARFGPAFAAARPDPDGTSEVAEAWQPWAELLRYGLLPPDDPRALLVRHQLPPDPNDHPHTRVAGSSSITLLAAGRDLGPAGLRYDFTAHPEHPGWRHVTI